MAKTNKKTTKSPQRPWPALSLYPCLFILLWVFVSFVYGDVFYIAQQHTYFAFDAQLLREVTGFWYGYAIVLGRFLMLPFRFPVVGGALFALMLTLVSYMINYVGNFKGYLKLIGLSIPIGWLVFIQSLRLDLFYHYEPSFFMYAPALLLLVLALVSGIVRWVTKHPFPSPITLDKESKRLPQYTFVLTALIAVMGMSYFSIAVDQNTIVTAKLQRQLQGFQWEDMVETAKKASRPTRPICAYNALALAYSNQLEQGLFNTYYQYPASHLTNRNDYEDIGTFYYTADIALYAGLANPSWHNNIDHLTMEGLSAYKLKNIFLTALVNNEIAAAEKILYIIEQMPFEGKFVEKYTPMLYDRNLMAQDPVLGKVCSLLPKKNAMEQDFFVPLLLGYYVEGEDCLPQGTENISMAASLYTKSLGNFMQTLSKMPRTGMLLPLYEEAVVLSDMHQHRKQEQYSPVIINNMRQMRMDAKQMSTSDKKEIAQALKDKYQGMYYFYYHYQNVPDENYPEPTPEIETESKIN